MKKNIKNQEDIKSNMSYKDRIAYRYNAIIETTSDGFWVTDIEGNFLEVNNSFCKLSGYSKEELLSMNISYIEAAESAKDTKEHIEKIIQSTFSDRFETKHRKKNGDIYNAEITTTFSMINGGRFFVFIRDISERKKSEKELILAAKVFSTMTNGVVITDASQKIINANKAFCDNMGYTKEEVLGQKPSFLSSGWHDAYFYKEMWKEINKKGRWQGEIIDRKKNGELYISETSIVSLEDKDGNITNYIAVSSDITLKKEQEKVINNLAYYDGLTKLPNRIFFEDRFNRKINLAKKKKRNLALLFIDLDNFKNINNTFGHLIGDKFLQNAAKRLQEITREEDVIGRFGGDEFIILIEDFVELSDLAILANKIVEAFNQPFQVDRNKFFSGASIGISVFPDNGASYHELMKAADTAMYYVKSSGKSGYEFYSKIMSETVSARMKLSNNLRNALENEEFTLFYQPKIDLSTNTIYGMESLLRWNNANLGAVSPDQFIPVLEESGQIYSVGLWVIRQALNDTKILHSLGFSDLIVSINVSYFQIQNDNFLADLKNIVTEIGIKKTHIELEITETQIMNNIESALVKLNEITSYGIKISIDDFGTGYSSLSYLKQLPADTIKIDKSFVLDIDKDEDDKSIVKAIIALSESLNKNVIAEGSETQAHIDTLKELGCKRVQGFFYSKPLPYDAFLIYLKNFK
ncbi:MAG: EAL domain-containing protein [Sulfurospirillaceae bacterium]|nr:EAL domain-containing protein [Sulfurospirillaceae bacterium]